MGLGCFKEHSQQQVNQQRVGWSSYRAQYQRPLPTSNQPDYENSQFQNKKGKSKLEEAPKYTFKPTESKLVDQRELSNQKNTDPHQSNLKRPSDNPNNPQASNGNFSLLPIVDSDKEKQKQKTLKQQSDKIMTSGQHKVNVGKTKPTKQHFPHNNQNINKKTTPISCEPKGQLNGKNHKQSNQTISGQDYERQNYLAMHKNSSNLHKSDQYLIQIHPSNPQKNAVNGAVIEQKSKSSMQGKNKNGLSQYIITQEDQEKLKIISNNNKKGSNQSNSSNWSKTKLTNKQVQPAQGKVFKSALNRRDGKQNPQSIGDKRVKQTVII